jgi:hypothetical protein
MTSTATPRLTELVVGDPPEAWRAAGFAVDDDGVARVGQVAIRLVGRDDGKRIRGWSFADLDDRDDIDGLPVLPARDQDAGAADPGSHPNGALRIDHVVVLTPALERTLAVFDTIGLETRATRETDTYGMPMRQAFIRSGEVILEIIGPVDPSDDDGPAGFFGLAHTVADLDATASLLGPALGDIKDAVQPGRQIATLRHRDVGVSVATAFMTPDDDRAPGG